jgi:hypothetical protein
MTQNLWASTESVLLWLDPKNRVKIDKAPIRHLEAALTAAAHSAPKAVVDRDCRLTSCSNTSLLRLFLVNRVREQWRCRTVDEFKFYNALI